VECQLRACRGRAQGAPAGKSGMSRRNSAIGEMGAGNLPVGDAAWRWVNEDYYTADRLPLVGVTEERFYLATGFNGWGISNGTAARTFIADQIRGRSNPWAGLYDPHRTNPDDFNRGGDSLFWRRSAAGGSSTTILPPRRHWTAASSVALRADTPFESAIFGR
jgi:hypothetical protein